MRSGAASLGVPLTCYVVVTLVVPWLNGAGGRPGFAEHAAVVTALCGLAFLLRGAIGPARRVVGRRRGWHHTPPSGTAQGVDP